MDGMPPGELASDVKRRSARHPLTDRRQELLSATIACLARLGPRGTTGREICREAGVSHGLLRHYFVNPDNLLLEAYQMLCDQYLEAIASGSRSVDASPWAAIDGFFEHLFSDFWANPQVLGAWSAFWTLVTTRDDFAQASAAFNDRLRAMLVRAVRLVPEADRTTMPIDDAIILLSAVMEGLWLDFCLLPDRITREQAVRLCEVAARRILGR